MFTKEDFKIESTAELLELLPIFVFVGLIAPFLGAAYTVGFVLDKLGLIER